jgi:hypothetical protein
MERSEGWRESNGIDSLLGGRAMPKAYSGGHAGRVIAGVESGVLSARGIAYIAGIAGARV